MFHRVKSESQATEAGKDEQNNTAYTPESKPADRGVTPRSYEQPKSSSEERKPTMAQQDDTALQNKYVPEEATRPSEPTRAYQPSVARPSGYNAAPSTPSAYAPTSASTTVDYTSPNDRTLTIGRGINLSGEIDACDHLLVEGTVEAALKGAKVLDIAQSGTFYGTVEIEEATIAGRFEGDITVSGRLTVRAGGVVTGSIVYRQLEVEAGAVIDGRMTPLKGNVDPKAEEKYRAGTEASAMAKAKEIASKKHDREPANAEGALFSKARSY